MARPRKPERDKAKKMYLESGGKISTKELAAAVGVDDGRIRKWKSLDKWEDALQNQPKKNAVTHGAFASVSIEDLTEEQRNAILSMQPGETLSRMNEELQGLLVRKEYLTGLLQGFTDPAKQQEYYTDKIVHMVVPVPQEERAQAEEMGPELELAADPEGGKESLKTAMKTIIKASPFDRAMKVEAAGQYAGTRSRSKQACAGTFEVSACTAESNRRVRHRPGRRRGRGRRPGRRGAGRRGIGSSSAKEG